MRPDAEAPDATRQQILAASVGTSGAVRGILFELDDHASRPCYRPAMLSPGQDSPEGPSAIAGDSLLTRWLRVNDAVLLIPDSIGILDELSEADRHTLRTLAMKACVPLVHDGELTAWIALVGDASPHLLEAQAQRVLPQAHAWAAQLHDAKTAWRATVKAASVSRVNRLSVTGELASSLAHEVRSPLAAVRSIVQMVRDEDAPAGDRDRLLTTVMVEVDRVNEVLSRMLALGRPHTPRQESCNLTFIADAASDFCRAYAKRQGQRLVRSGTEPLAVVGDPHELRQVLINVLLNACQASEAGATVVVETGRQSDEVGQPWATVRVTDSGVGIPADDLPKVFEAFYSTKPGGGGLGLPICRGIIERHLGRIALTSQLGTGTTVSIQLPLH